VRVITRTATGTRRSAAPVRALRGTATPQGIVGEIRVVVTPEEHATLARVRSVDREAHLSYLKGRYYWNKRTIDGLAKARARTSGGTGPRPNIRSRLVRITLNVKVFSDTRRGAEQSWA
jgi:hypothetical protein